MGPKRTKQIFVAYPYRLYRKSAYRAALRTLAKDYDVAFNFADEKITRMHILDKIITYMRGADLCVFDLSGWNPNVALEFGVAYGFGLKWIICFNPTKKGTGEVPSDIRGYDRIEYKSLRELTGKMALFLEENADRRATSVEEAGATRGLQKRLLLILTSGKGFRADQLAAALGTTVETIQVLLEPLIKSKQVRYTGQTRGRKYFRC